MERDEIRVLLVGTGDDFGNELEGEGFQRRADPRPRVARTGIGPRRGDRRPRRPRAPRGARDAPAQDARGRHPGPHDIGTRGRRRRRAARRGGGSPRARLDRTRAAPPGDPLRRRATTAAPRARDGRRADPPAQHPGLLRDRRASTADGRSCRHPGRPALRPLRRSLGGDRGGPRRRGRGRTRSRRGAPERDPRRRSSRRASPTTRSACSCPATPGAPRLRCSRGSWRRSPCTMPASPSHAHSRCRSAVRSTIRAVPSLSRVCFEPPKRRCDRTHPRPDELRTPPAIIRSPGGRRTRAYR